MKKNTFFLSIVLFLVFNGCQFKSKSRVEKLLSQMTLEEKIGQLNHLKGNYSTDIYQQNLDLQNEIKAGRVGALTPWVSFDQLISWQRTAVDSTRLGIPLVFAADVIHGYRTIFPIPLAQAASWDLQAIEKAERISATEATAAGLNWNFAPMVDVSRDARWGRCMEGGGEDTYLNSEIAKARVRGIQGSDLRSHSTMLATAKHFAAYGAIEAGKEYNNTDVPERVLREVYLPPFKACVDQNIATVMNSFSTIDRVPASANSFLLKDILKGEWGFKGFTVSDANSFLELIPHGIAKDSYEAAEKCLNAGSDTDLWGQVYIDNLEQLVCDGRISEAQIDEAVRRVLRYKESLGLLDNPYGYLNPSRLDSVLLHPNHLEAAEELACKSLVLLKNEQTVLPIKKDGHKTIALIGPLAHSTRAKNLMGNWSGFGKAEDVITIYDGLQKHYGMDATILLAEGCEDWGICPENLISEAVKVAKKADVVVLAIGEHGWHSGECGSRTDITLPGDQEELVYALSKTGKPMIGLVFNGRPLVLTNVEPHFQSLIVCWQPGIMAGNAIAKVISGDFNPCGKLPMTFPMNVGQVPIYYNYLNSGRPKLDSEDKRWGLNAYSDSPNEPLYPFGYGLSYTRFKYGEVRLDKPTLNTNESVTVSFELSNIGDTPGTDICQLYIRDLVGTVSRPVKELKRFKRVFLQPGEKKQVEFELNIDDLKYWNHNMEFIADPGQFEVMVGTNSACTQSNSFVLTKN